MALPIGAALGVIGSLFGGGGKDAGRMRTTDQLYQQALNGDVAAEVHLRCLSGIRDPRAITYGFATDLSKCGWATGEARQYGQQKIAQLAAARKLSQAGAAITNATGGTATPAPTPNPSSPAGQALAGTPGEYAGVPVWAWLAGAGLLSYTLYFQARR